MTDTQKQPASVPAELVADLTNYLAIINPNNAMGAGSLAAHIAAWLELRNVAYGREQAQQWIPVGTAHYQVAGGNPGIQWYVKPNGTIVYVKEPPTC